MLAVLQKSHYKLSIREIGLFKGHNTLKYTKVPLLGLIWILFAAHEIFSDYNHKNILLPFHINCCFKT